MTTKMPRGAIPTSREKLAAAEPYRAESSVETRVPSGKCPTPNHELAAARPYKAHRTAPESFLAWPIEIDFWGNEKVDNSTWAEEAFAKACAEPRVFIPTSVVLLASQECGSSNFAAFMQTHGFQMDGTAYLDGPFNSVDWTNTVALNSAISNGGPVKIGIASANPPSGTQSRITSGKSGWGIYGLPTGQEQNYCAGLCGYGPLATLVDLVERRGVNVNVPSGMPSGLCYAMFMWDSVGIIDRQSLVNITGEAWVRIPTTIVRSLNQ